MKLANIKTTERSPNSKDQNLNGYSIQNYKQEKEQKEIEIAREIEKKSLPPGMRLMEEQER